MTSKIIKMCPKESELLPLGVSQCEICMKQFNNQSRLTMHLRKLHGVEPEIPRVGKCQDIQFQFFCPVIDCKYRKDLYFEALKQLRQHYQRVHLVRNLCCPICTTAKFSLEKDLRYHVRICSKRTPQPKLSSGSSVVVEHQRSILVALDQSTVVSQKPKQLNLPATLVHPVQPKFPKLIPKPSIRLLVPPQTISFGTQTTFESSLAEVERKRLLKVSKRKKEKKKDKFCHISTQTEVDSNCADHNSYDAVGLREMARSQQDEPMNYYFNRGTGEPKSQANVTAVGCMAIPLPTVQADFRCQTYFPVDTADVAVMVDFLRSENGIAPQLQSFDPCDYDQYASNNDAGPSGFDSFEDDFGGISSNIETQTDMRELAELFANDLPSPIHMETQTGGLEGYIDLNDIQTQTNLIDFIDAGFHSSVETQTWVYPSTL